MLLEFKMPQWKGSKLNTGKLDPHSVGGEGGTKLRCSLHWHSSVSLPCDHFNVGFYSLVANY